MALLENAVIIITGARGTGKTTLAATYLPPSQVDKVFYHDSERSANKIVQDLRKADLSFGYYGDLLDQFGDLPGDDDLLSRLDQGKLPWANKEEKGALAKYYEYILSNLAENLNGEQFDVYILDTLEKFEAGMYAWVESNIEMFGYRTAKAAKADAKIWTNIYYPLYDQFFSAVFARGVKTIIFCSHLKNPWVNRKPVPGKVAPGGKPRLYLLGSLVLWLVNDASNGDGAPAGLVLKERLGKLEVVGDEWKQQTMLPKRIPHCTWVDINRYLKEGCDLAQPARGEVPNHTELEMISELLTNEQMRLMILTEEKELEEAKSANGHATVTGTFTLPRQDSEVQKLVEKVQGLGFTEFLGDRELLEAKLLGTFPPPLREKNRPLVERVIKEMMGE